MICEPHIFEKLKAYVCHLFSMMPWLNICIQFNLLQRIMMYGYKISIHHSVVDQGIHRWEGGAIFLQYFIHTTDA